MTAGPEEAEVVHSSPGRLRLKIPRRKHDRAYFLDLTEDIMSLAGVEEVRANPVTASVLILHDGDADSPLVGAMADAGWIEPVAPSFFSAPSGAEGGAGMRNVVLFGLILLGIVQLMRGRALAPAATLFWMANEFARQQSGRKPAGD